MDLCFKFDILEIKISQEYEPTKDTSLPIVRYACGKFNFKRNCSKKKNEFTHLKTIVLNDKRIDIENLDDASISTKENLKSEGNLFTHTIKNPKGRFACIYKVTVGEIEISQNYEPILKKNPSGCGIFSE